MRKAGCLRKKYLLNDQKLEGFEGFDDVGLVGVALRYILALHPERFDLFLRGGIKHFGDGQTGFRWRCNAPDLLNLRADSRVTHVLVSRELIWHAAHVGVALNVVLTAQGQHTRSLFADAAGQHAEIAQSDDRGGTLGELREPQAGDEQRWAVLAEQESGCANRFCSQTRDLRGVGDRKVVQEFGK